MLIIIVSNNLCVAGRTDWWMLKLGILFDPEMEFFNVACVFYPVHSGLCLHVLRLHLQIHRSPFTPPLDIQTLPRGPYVVRSTTLYPLCALSALNGPGSPPSLTSLTCVVLQISGETLLPLGSFHRSP